jgi:hypothetical protein
VEWKTAGDSLICNVDATKYRYHAKRCNKIQVSCKKNGHYKKKKEWLMSRSLVSASRRKTDIVRHLRTQPQAENQASTHRENTLGKHNFTACRFS